MTILILHNDNILFCIISSLFCISLIGTLDTISNVRRLRDALLVEIARLRDEIVDALFLDPYQVGARRAPLASKNWQESESDFNQGNRFLKNDFEGERV